MVANTGLLPVFVCIKQLIHIVSYSICLNIGTVMLLTYALFLPWENLLQKRPRRNDFVNFRPWILWIILIKPATPIFIYCKEEIKLEKKNRLHESESLLIGLRDSRNTLCVYKIFTQNNFLIPLEMFFSCTLFELNFRGLPNDVVSQRDKS